jgi:hypothetical protein
MYGGRPRWVRYGQRSWPQVGVVLAAVAVLTVRIVLVWRFPATVAGDSFRYRNLTDPVFPFQVWRGGGPGVLDQLIFLLPVRWGLTTQVMVSAGLVTAAALHLTNVGTARQHTGRQHTGRQHTGRQHTGRQHTGRQHMVQQRADHPGMACLGAGQPASRTSTTDSDLDPGHAGLGRPDGGCAVGSRTGWQRASSLWPYLLLVWSSSPWLLLWDTWVLTEAVTVAGCVATAVAAATWVAGDPGQRRSAAWLSTAGATCALLARPFVLVLLVPLLVSAAVLGRDRSRRRTGLRWCGVVLALAAVFATWQVVTFERFADRDIVRVRAADRFGRRGADPGYLSAAAAHGMPDCPDVRAAMTKRFATRLALVRTSRCPGFRAWLSRGGLSWSAELSAHPSVVLREFSDQAYWTTTPVTQYLSADGRGQVLVDRFGRPVVEAWARRMNTLLWWVTFGSVIVAVVAAAARRRYRLAGFVLLAACWSAGFVFVAWADDGLESWRHVLPGLVVPVPLALAVLACVASPSVRSGGTATSDQRPDLIPSARTTAPISPAAR